MTPDAPKSPARVAAGRANGLKSRGAKTPEGKAASALNATTHGFSARTIVLSVEDSEAFHEMRDNYIAHLKPANPVEEQMLDDIVIAKWRHRRLTTVETSTLEIEMRNVEPEINAKYLRVSDHVRVAFAYRSAERSERLLSAINRHAARLFREYRHALQIFKDEHAPAEKVNRQNEGNRPPPLSDLERPPGGSRVSAIHGDDLPSNIQVQVRDDEPRCDAVRLDPVLAPLCRERSRQIVHGWRSGKVSRVVCWFADAIKDLFQLGRVLRLTSENSRAAADSGLWKRMYTCG